MKWLTWLKLKLTLGTGTAFMLAGAATVVALSEPAGHAALTAQEIAQQTQEAYAALTSYSDEGTVMAEAGGVVTRTQFAIRLQRPNSYRVDWIQTTGGRYTSRGNVWSSGCKNFMILANAGQQATYRPQEVHQRPEALAMSARSSGQASSTIPGLFFQQDGNDALGLRAPLERERDERIGDIDCYVIKNAARTLWIGQRDHLIHQARTGTAGASITETHENLAMNPDDLSPYFNR